MRRETHENLSLLVNGTARYECESSRLAANVPGLLSLGLAREQ